MYTRQRQVNHGSTIVASDTLRWIKNILDLFHVDVIRAGIDADNVLAIWPLDAKLFYMLRIIIMQCTI
jgi:hypothetical protein